MAIFEGAGVALVTPFNEDFTVNYPELDRILDDQIANGTDAIIICGTSGEAATLSEQEHMDVVRHTIRYVDHRIPVIAGTGSNCTETAIMLSKEAEEAGADGCLVVTPYYNKCTQAGLIRHFEMIAEAITIPIILYNVPSRTGVNMAPQTVAYLAEHVSNIVGIKEASGNIAQVTEIASLVDTEAFSIYSGNDDMIIPLMSVGGKGVISVLSNVAPRQTHDMCAKFLAGDVAGARKIQLEAFELIKSLFCEVNPIPVKAGMNMQGFAAGPMRMPLTEMTDANKARLEKAMREFGCL
ncbi:MAG: 4-hydroxy-tetrahydrodipicolinate synthase [Lachnospiraceae bacterium]|nr:4-hydroxy-tetrahydrodipicolinate synthase [Lachnospiraceae bacterium]